MRLHHTFSTARPRSRASLAEGCRPIRANSAALPAVGCELSAWRGPQRLMDTAQAAPMRSEDATALGAAGLVIWFADHDYDVAFLSISRSNVVALGNSA